MSVVIENIGSDFVRFITICYVWDIRHFVFEWFAYTQDGMRCILVFN